MRKTARDTRSRSRRRAAGGTRRLDAQGYRILAETAADAVFSIDRKSRILFVNPSAKKMFGYSASEMLGRSLTMIMPERLRARHETSLARYLATGNKQLDWQAVELTARHKSGREIPVEISFGESKRKGQSTFTGVVRNIAERKRAEALQSALYRVAERSQAPPTDLPELYTRINSIMRELMAARAFRVVLRDEASGALSCPFFAGELPTSRVGALTDGLTEQVLRTGQALLASSEPRGASLNWLGAPLTLGERTLGALVLQARPESAGYGERDKELLGFVARQVVAAMERQRAELELKRTVSVLRSTLDSTADGILVVDHSGRVVSFNQRFAQLWRIPRPMLTMRDDAALLAHVLAQLAHPAQFLDGVRRLYAQLEAESFDELEFKDGRIFERYSIPHHQDYVPVGRVWSFRDVTKLRDLERRLRRSHKLAALQGLAGSAAHDFSELLALIVGRGELALAGSSAEEPLRRHIQAILDTAGRATALTRQLLAFSQQPAPPDAGAGPEHPAASEAPGSPKTVLLVEQSATVRLLASEALRDEGYEVLEASRGAEALLVPDRHSGPVHLLVTDAALPDMDGHALARRLAAAWPALKALFVSDLPDDALAARGLAPNAAVLPRPFSAASLTRRVRDVLDGRLRSVGAP